MLKILFLDLDGVMVPDREERLVETSVFNSDVFGSECVKILNEIIEETDCQIVLTSDWRLFFSLSQIWEIFKFNKVSRMPIAFTGLATDSGGWPLAARLEEFRGIEIRRWLKQHGLEFDNKFDFWVAVDDMDLSPHVRRFVLSPFTDGLAAPGIKEKIIKKLNGE